MKRANAPLMILAVVAGCGPTVVRTYSGPDLGPAQSSSLWSNQHMSMRVDEKYDVPLGDVAFRRRFELAPGHHVVRLICLFTDDVQYVRVAGAPAGAPVVDRALSGQGALVLRQAGAPTQNSAAITGAPPPTPARPQTIETIRSSRPRLFALDAAAGHSYLPRVHFTRDEAGQPGCDIHIDDITGDKNGADAQTF